MRKITAVLISLLAIGILSIGLAAAQGFGMGSARQGSAGNTGIVPGTHHEQMSEIFESGSFEDLEAYRLETGLPMMPWVQDQESFELAKERHDQMLAWHEENGIEPGSRMMQGNGMMGSLRGSGMGQGRNGGCPMLGQATAQ